MYYFFDLHHSNHKKFEIKFENLKPEEDMTFFVSKVLARAARQKILLSSAFYQLSTS